MRRVVLAAIRFYQRHLSPHKGFCCAYRHHTGRASCSALGYRAVRRYGVFTGLGLTRQRTRLCGVVHRRHQPALRRLHAERGVCDLPCDLPCDGGHGLGGCDLPDTRTLGRACDYLSCCDCGSCDWPKRERRKSDRASEKTIYIPPKRWDR
ncbi:MAG: membrane protein insertion efficiency factor YidD [Rubrivivax sp.]